MVLTVYFYIKVNKRILKVFNIIFGNFVSIPISRKTESSSMLSLN